MISDPGEADIDPRGDREFRQFIANAADDVPNQSRAVLQTPAVVTGPIVGAEKFMAQVAVTVLDIDKIKARGMNQLGRAYKIIN